jgi:hypothetical protein
MAWEDAIDALSLQAPTDLGELHLRLVKGLRELRPRYKTFDVGVTETIVAHGQSSIPSFVTLTPRGAIAVAVERPSAADAQEPLPHRGRAGHRRYPNGHDLMPAPYQELTFQFGASVEQDVGERHVRPGSPGGRGQRRR